MSRVAFGRLVSLVTEKAEESSFKIGLEAIESGTGKLAEMPNAEYSGEGVAFEPGDLLFGKLRPYLAKGWLADRPGAAVGDFHVYRCGPRLVPEYARWIVLANNFLDPVVSSVFGAKMPRASWDFVRTVEVHVPSLVEQRAIADYLDRETAQIDTLIEEQQRLIEMLRERRQATVSDALATGSPTTRLRRLVDPARPMSYGILQCGEPVAVGVPYIGPSDMVGGGQSPVLEDLRRTTQEIAAAYPRSVLRGGDVVVSIGPAYGKVALLADDLTGSNLTQDTVRVALRPEVADSDYLVWVLGSREVADYWDFEIMGATFRRLNLGTLARTPIPLPPLDVQRRISRSLDEQIARIDALIMESERFITLSRERRAALITSAVTGQIDVRDEVA